MNFCEGGKGGRILFLNMLTQGFFLISHSTMQSSWKKDYKCDFCDVIFTREASKKRHIQRIHNHVKPILDCTMCGAQFDHLQKLQEHRRIHQPTSGFKYMRNAFGKTCSIYRKIYGKKIISFQEAAALNYNDLFSLLNYELSERNLLKVALIANVAFVKLSAEENIQDEYEIVFRTPTETIRSVDDIREFREDGEKYIQNRIEDFIAHGSGWVLDEVLYSDLELGTCNPLSGSCNKLSITFIKDLKRIKPRKGGGKKDCFFQAIAYHFLKTTEVKKLKRFIRMKMHVKQLPIPM